MKRYLLSVLILLLFASNALSAGFPFDAPTQQAAASFTDYCPGTGLLLCESFEKSGGTCGDGSSTNCWVTWTVTGTPNFGAAALDGGTKAINLSNTGAVNSIETSFTASDNVYSFFKGKFSAVGTGTREIYNIHRCSMYVTPDGNIRVQDEVDWATASVSALSIDGSTVYNFWVWWKRGASNNAECGACFSTTTTNPGSGNQCSIHTGFTRDVQASSVKPGNGYSAGSGQVGWVIDNLKVDDATIAN